MMIALLLFGSSHASAQSYDKFINNKFADYLFGLKKSQWDDEARNVFQSNWFLKMIPQETGAVFYAFDTSGGPLIEFVIGACSAGCKPTRLHEQG